MTHRIYLSEEDVIAFNRVALDVLRVKKADRPELRSRQKLGAALEACRSHEGSVHEKAAVLLSRLVKAHAFASGNRRTAFLAAKEFVLANGGRFAVPDDAKNAKTLQGIREDFYTVEEISRWIEDGTIKEFRRHHA